MAEGICKHGCTGDDEAVHNGWFRCTPESRTLLAQEREALNELIDRATERAQS